MKIKKDFVTNSSSCSFILEVETIKELSIQEFVKYFNSISEIDKYLHEIDVKLIKGNQRSYCNHNESNIFRIDFGFTSMYNNIDDVPTSIKDILLLDKMGDINWFTVKNLIFEE